MEDTTIALSMDIQPFTASVKEVREGFEELKTGAAAVASALAGALNAPAAPMKSLQTQLLTLRLSFGKLQAALEKAAEPILQRILPAVQSAVWWGLRMANILAQLSRALFGGTEQTEDMASAQKKLASSAKKASRSLASFDEIQRLSGSSGSGGTLSTTDSTPAASQIAPEILSLANKIKQTFAPLRTWLTDEAIPAGTAAITAAFSALWAILKPLGEGFGALLQKLSPVTAFLGDTVVFVLEQARSLFESLAAVFTEKGAVITGILSGVGDVLAHLWEGAEPVLTALRTAVGAVFTFMAQNAARDIGLLVESCGGLVNLVAGMLTGDWARAWKGATDLVKSQVNLVIGFLNAMLSAVAGGINGMISALNSIRFTVPDWVPGIGGRSVGFSLGKVSAPQIPYLAQGAVLPANKPFLAVVGDQRHGTNIEAPLATIQEAVGLVMEDYTAANAAGQEAIVSVLGDILQAVLGIEIGDEVLGAASERYQRRMRMVRGGL